MKFNCSQGQPFTEVRVDVSSSFTSTKTPKGDSVGQGA